MSEQNIVELSIPQPSQVAVTDAQTMLAAAKAFMVATPEHAIEIQQTRQRINAQIKALENERDGMTSPINIAKKKIMDFFRSPLEFLEESKRICDAKIIEYNNRIERERQEAQRKAQEAADKQRRELEAKARAEREKAEAEQRERDRLARIEQNRLDEERKQARERELVAKRAGDAAAQRAAAEEQERLKREREAQERETTRRNEETRARADAQAAALEERAAATVAEVVTPESTKVKGVGTRDNWVFTIIDASKVKPEFCVPDEAKIGKLVKALRGQAADLVGGIKVENKPIVASRAG